MGTTTKKLTLNNNNIVIEEHLFASPVWSSDGGFVPIGDVVAGDVC